MKHIRTPHTHTHTQREREREIVNEQNNYKDFAINTREFIIELRIKIMKKTINDFVFDMGWFNDKYYSKVVNGQTKDGIKIYSSPTINYIFGGLKHAMKYHKEYIDKKDEIIALINRYFLDW